jgi:hypothetical protein
MRSFKQLFFFLAALLVAAFVLSLLLPVNQKIERSITINAPAAIVYGQLIKLENFNKWSVWAREDSSATYTLTGKDGTVGATSSWKGDPGISGEGKIEISGLEPDKKITHQFQFTQPRKGHAESVFLLSENNGVTVVTWKFIFATPRPWNIANLFNSLDKAMGKDFENGLATLKADIEKTNGTTSGAYEVMTMDFPATTFATVSQTVKWSDIPAFFAQHLPIIYSEAAKMNAKPGTPAGLYYIWDENNQQSNMAAALPVSANVKIENNIINWSILLPPGLYM